LHYRVEFIFWQDLFAIRINIYYNQIVLKKSKKKKIIDEHKLHETDTGSAEVQIALISEELKKLTNHLKEHPKDNHSRRGLLGMVSKRKKLLEWLEGEDEKRYKKTVKSLGLKNK